tara:strand:+ start:1545 stop:3611 length:2067 start_codon:yes stop_codon:yes gene_type:complete
MPATSANVDHAQVDSFLVLAADTTVSYKDRVKLIKKAIKLDDTGRAMFALGELYLDGSIISSWRDASLWLQRAMRKDKKNLDYRIAYARYLWASGKRKTAYKSAKKAIEINPNHVGALYVAGRYAAYQMSRYLEGERVDYSYDSFGNPSVRGYSLEQFGEQDRDEAIGYLTRALNVDADHRPSLLLLGLVYYEARMPDKLVVLFKDYLTRHPDDSDAYFFLGLGYQAQDDLDRAYPSYVKGLERMNLRQRQFMMSVFMLAGKEDIKEAMAMPDEAAIRAFWTGRDPLFLTPVNERLMEHCGRVAYANLRFGDPEREIPGWSTDKGQAYIRYGRPVARSVRPAEIDTGIDEPMWYQTHLAWVNSQGTMPFEYHPRTEFWDYGSFRLVFTNIDTRDTWHYRIGWLGRQPVEFERLVSKIPEFYVDPYKWERYDAPFQIAQFRGEEGKSRVEVYYALAGEEVDHETVSPGVEGVDINQGLFLFDSKWDTVRKDIGRIQMMPWVTYKSTREGYLFASENMMLDPGSYYLAAEAEDQIKKTVGTFRGGVNVQRFGHDTLQVSDLLLARRVVEREESPIGRQRFLILPNPLQQCNRLGQAYFYYEIYNMEKDEFGATKYEVTYQVRTQAESEVAEEKEWTTAVSYTHQGNREWEPIYQVLNLDAMPGLREFRVVVRDLNSLQEATSETEFRVMW